jgi:hypothetical protein
MRIIINTSYYTLQHVSAFSAIVRCYVFLHSHLFSSIFSPHLPMFKNYAKNLMLDVEIICYNSCLFGLHRRCILTNVIFSCFSGYCKNLFTSGSNYF